MRVLNTWHNHQLAELGLVPLSEALGREGSNEARIQRLRRAIQTAARTDATLRKRPGVPAKALHGVPQELIDAAAHLANIQAMPPRLGDGEPLHGEKLSEALSPVSTCVAPGEPFDEIPYRYEAYRDAVTHLFAHDDPRWNAVRDAFRRHWVGEPLVELAARLPPCCLRLETSVVGAMVDGMLGYAPHGHYQLDDPEQVWGWDDSLLVDEDEFPLDKRGRRRELLKLADARFLAWLRDEARSSLHIAVQLQLATRGRPATEIPEYFSSARAWEQGLMTEYGPSLGDLSERAPDLRFVVPDDPLIFEPASRALLRLTGSLVARDAEIAALGKAIEEEWWNSCWHRWWSSGAMGSDRIELVLRMYRAEGSLRSDSLVRDALGHRVALEGMIELARSAAMFVEHVCEPVENVEIGLRRSVSDKETESFAVEIYPGEDNKDRAEAFHSRLRNVVRSTSTKRPAHADWTRRCARALRRHDAFANAVGPLEGACSEQDFTFERIEKFSRALEGVADLDEILCKHLRDLATAAREEGSGPMWNLSKSVLSESLRERIFGGRTFDKTGWSPAWIARVLDDLADTPLTFRQINRDDLWSEVPSAVALAWVLGSMVREVRNALTHGAGFRATAYPLEGAAVWTRPGTVDGRRIIVTLSAVQRLFAMLTWSLSVIDRLDPLPP